ncbi:hypothetical protein [uncultured Aquimarina sp.]|uniref:hypothetical protein n=1 Tax=uncultured Aquimarina sp. TaxID=575652 RepID=UPI00261336FE|nr:hypothetical protein [uncultured Aquimarina sp.]
MKSEQFNARSKGNFLFAMALDFYKLNKKQKCADKSIGSGLLALLRFIYLALPPITKNEKKIIIHIP